MLPPFDPIVYQNDQWRKTVGFRRCENLLRHDRRGIRYRRLKPGQCGFRVDGLLDSTHLKCYHYCIRCITGCSTQTPQLEG